MGNAEYMGEFGPSHRRGHSISSNQTVENAYKITTLVIKVPT